MPIKEAVQALIHRFIKLIFRKLHFEHEKLIERVFSWLVGIGLRIAQTKTLKSLKVLVAIAFLDHNLWFSNP